MKDRKKKCWNGPMGTDRIERETLDQKMIDFSKTCQARVNLHLKTNDFIDFSNSGVQPTMTNIVRFRID